MHPSPGNAGAHNQKLEGVRWWGVVETLHVALVRTAVAWRIHGLYSQPGQVTSSTYNALKTSVTPSLTFYALWGWRFKKEQEVFESLKSRDEPPSPTAAYDTEPRKPKEDRVQLGRLHS